MAIIKPKPESYRARKGCWNCKYSAIPPSHVRDYILYHNNSFALACAFEVGEPKHLNESDWKLDQEYFDRWFDFWNLRSVAPFGICDEYKLIEDIDLTFLKDLE